jgi:putative NADPH-quinone reductase
MPALLKGFLDRVLEPGFAFAEREDGRGWAKLLRGKSTSQVTHLKLPAPNPHPCDC